MNRSLYAARRRRNGIMLSLSLAATLLGLGWLIVILVVLYSDDGSKDPLFITNYAVINILDSFPAPPGSARFR